jgi:hypothetical protein
MKAIKRRLRMPTVPNGPGDVIAGQRRTRGTRPSSLTGLLERRRTAMLIGGAFDPHALANRSDIYG